MIFQKENEWKIDELGVKTKTNDASAPYLPTYIYGNWNYRQVRIDYDVNRTPFETIIKSP